MVSRLAGDWKQFTGMVKQKWGKLTDEDLTTFGAIRTNSPGSSSKNTAMPKSRRKKKSPSSGKRAEA